MGTRPTLYVLIDENGLRDEVVAMVTDDPEVAALWQARADEGHCCHVEEVDLNRATHRIDARGGFFKQARRINSDITK